MDNPTFLEWWQALSLTGQLMAGYLAIGTVIAIAGFIAGLATEKPGSYSAAAAPFWLVFMPWGWGIALLLWGIIETVARLPKGDQR